MSPLAGRAGASLRPVAAPHLVLAALVALAAATGCDDPPPGRASDTTAPDVAAPDTGDLASDTETPTETLEPPDVVEDVSDGDLLDLGPDASDLDAADAPDDDVDTDTPDDEVDAGDTRLEPAPAPLLTLAVTTQPPSGGSIVDLAADEVGAVALYQLGPNLYFLACYTPELLLTATSDLVGFASAIPPQIALQPDWIGLAGSAGHLLSRATCGGGQLGAAGNTPNLTALAALADSAGQRFVGVEAGAGRALGVLEVSLDEMRCMLDGFAAPCLVRACAPETDCPMPLPGAQGVRLALLPFDADNGVHLVAVGGLDATLEHTEWTFAVIEPDSGVLAPVLEQPLSSPPSQRFHALEPHAFLLAGDGLLERHELVASPLQSASVERHGALATATDAGRVLDDAGTSWAFVLVDGALHWLRHTPGDADTTAVLEPASHPATGPFAVAATSGRHLYLAGPNGLVRLDAP